MMQNPIYNNNQHWTYIYTLIQFIQTLYITRSILFPEQQKDLVAIKAQDTLAHSKNLECSQKCENVSENAFLLFCTLQYFWRG